MNPGIPFDLKRALAIFDSPVATRFSALLEHPRAFHRDHFAPGHVTGSAFILHPTRPETLLTHHRKLNRWLQLGGHSDGDPDTLAVALREAREESGIAEFDVLVPGIFDLDIHPIPERGQEPGHLHYDVRFLLRARTTDFQISEESLTLAWVPLAGISEPSLLRLAEKAQQHL